MPLLRRASLLTLMFFLALPAWGRAAVNLNPVATFATDANLGGERFQMHLGQELPALGRKWNDKLSSVSVLAPGVTVELYEHGNFQGRKAVLLQGSHHLSSAGLNDKVSSIRVLGQTTGDNSQNSESQNQALARGGALADRVRVHVLNLPRRALPPEKDAAMLLGPLVNGRVKIAWNEMPGAYGPSYAHLAEATLDGKWQKPEIILKGWFITTLLTHTDGSMALLAKKGRDLEEWWFLRLDPQGREVTRALLAGGQGQGPGQFWAGDLGQGRLVWTGQTYEIFIPVRQNWARPGEPRNIHNGDHFMALTHNGVVLGERTTHWTTSDSFHQRLAVTGSGKTLSLLVGNAYPLGLVFASRASAPVTTKVVFPDEAAAKTLQAEKGDFYPGFLGSALPYGEGVMGILATPLDENAHVQRQHDVLFVRTDGAGNIQSRHWVTRTPGEDENVVYLAPYGGRFLAAWAKTGDEKTGKTTLAVLNENGVVQEGPVLSKAPLSKLHDMVDLPGGGVAWLVPGEQDITLVTVGPP